MPILDNNLSNISANFDKNLKSVNKLVNFDRIVMDMAIGSIRLP